uniref:Major facilitator superfamily (MFS) profile domain-containing protein n=1 Tax=Globisporangium ultimum (strain ATCC 200006 / CBS 805.95 / DAOM BR144) TaxID=431595 RepID=K3WGH7_GLOUD
RCRRPSHRAEAGRIALVVVVLLSDLLFSGLVYGWAPLLLMLQDEQQYIELCDHSNALKPQNDSSPRSGCDAQENKLNLMFVVSVALMDGAALPLGFFLDYAGPKIAVAAAGVLEVAGLALLAFAQSQHFDVFVLAYTLIAVGGILTLMVSFPASFLVPKHQTAILAAANCLSDGSSIIFLGFYSIKSHFGVSRQYLLCILAAIAAVIYVVLIGLWHINEHTLRSIDAKGHDSQGTESTTSSELGPISNTNGTTAILQSGDCERVNSGDYRLPSISDDPSGQLVDAPIRTQIRTFEFVFIVVFAAVQELRTLVYIGTGTILLENYGDQEHDHLYTTIFSIVLPLGFLFIPIIDHVVDKKGLAAALVCTNILGLAYNSLALIPNLNVQCVTFFLFTGFQSFLYAVLSVFTAKIFGLQNMGTLIGLIYTVGAVMNLLEHPAVLLSNAYFGGELYVVQGICFALGVLLVPYTEWLRWREETGRHKPI